MSLRRLILLGICVCFLAIIAAFIAAFRPLSETLVRNIITKAQSNTVRFSYGDLEVSLPRATIKDVELWYRPAFVSLNIDKVDARISPLSLFLFRPSGDFELALYNGAGRGAFQVASGEVSGNLEISELDLSRHSQMQGLGLTKGLFSGNLKRFSLHNGELEQLEAELHLKDVTVPVFPKLSIRIPGSPTPLELDLPAIADLSTDMTVTMHRPDIALEISKFNSNLGDAKGKIQTAPPGNGELHINLSDLFMSRFSIYLPIISQNSLTTKDNKFKISLSSVDCSAAQRRGTIFNIGKSCFEPRIAPEK